MDNNKQMKNNDLEKIRKVDIDEIRRVTHIDASIISDILDEKFENLIPKPLRRYILFAYFCALIAHLLVKGCNLFVMN